MNSNINITGRHIKLTEPLSEYAHSKLDKITRHFDHLTSIDLVLSVEKLVQTAEATVNIPGHKLFASSDGEDLYAAIDGLIDKLDRQVIKHKEKMKNHRED